MFQSPPPEIAHQESSEGEEKKKSFLSVCVFFSALADLQWTGLNGILFKRKKNIFLSLPTNLLGVPARWAGAAAAGANKRSCQHEPNQDNQVRSRKKKRITIGGIHAMICVRPCLPSPSSSSSLATSFLSYHPFISFCSFILPPFRLSFYLVSSLFFFFLCHRFLRPKLFL